MRNYAIQLQKAYSLATGVFYPEILEEELRLAKEYENEKWNQAVILYSQELNKVLRLPYFMRLNFQMRILLRIITRRARIKRRE